MNYEATLTLNGKPFQLGDTQSGTATIFISCNGPLSYGYRDREDIKARLRASILEAEDKSRPINTSPRVAGKPTVQVILGGKEIQWLTLMMSGLYETEAQAKEAAAENQKVYEAIMDELKREGLNFTWDTWSKYSDLPVYSRILDLLTETFQRIAPSLQLEKDGDISEEDSNDKITLSITAQQDQLLNKLTKQIPAYNHISAFWMRIKSVRSTFVKKHFDGLKELMVAEGETAESGISQNNQTNNLPQVIFLPVKVAGQQKFIRRILMNGKFVTEDDWLEKYQGGEKAESYCLTFIMRELAAFACEALEQRSSCLNDAEIDESLEIDHAKKGLHIKLDHLKKVISFIYPSHNEVSKEIVDIFVEMLGKILGVCFLNINWQEVHPKLTATASSSVGNGSSPASLSPKKQPAPSLNPSANVIPALSSNVNGFVRIIGNMVEKATTTNGDVTFHEQQRSRSPSPTANTELAKFAIQELANAVKHASGEEGNKIARSLATFIKALQATTPSPTHNFNGYETPADSLGSSPPDPIVINQQMQPGM